MQVVEPRSDNSGLSQGRLFLSLLAISSSSASSSSKQLVVCRLLIKQEQLSVEAEGFGILHYVYKAAVYV